jgi:hypothetical protein
MNPFILRRFFRRMNKRTAACFFSALAVLSLAAAASKYEKPRTFKASELLPPTQLKGSHFEVAADVPTEGYLHVYSISSDYGAFDAEGTSMLLVRLQEVEALAQLDKVSRSEVFLKSAGNSVLNVGKNVISAVKDPVGTVAGIFRGLKRFGTNLGRRAKRAGDRAANSAKKDEDSKKTQDEQASDPVANAAKSILGVNKAMRRWARKVGVDPYTTNPVLRKALEDIGTADAAGNIMTKIVLPIPAVVSQTAQVGNLVWGKDPEELRKLNEKRLKELGADGETIKDLYISRGFTLSLQTRLVNGLYAVKAKGSADYAETATEADTEREGLFFAESAEMLQRFHAESAVVEILPDSRTLVAKTKNGRATVLLPVDWMYWTKDFKKTAFEIAGRAKAELGTGRLEIRLSGRMSDRAKEEMRSRGWAVVENVPLSSGWLAADASPGAQARSGAPDHK